MDKIVYVPAEIELITFSTEDVINTSVIDTTGGDGGNETQIQK